MLSPNSITSIAIGKFDGFHLGHKKLFENLDENGGVLIIYKGDYNLIPDKLHRFFTNFSCFYLDYEEIKNLTPMEFIDFLNNKFQNLKKIVVGYDFKFGKNRAGDANLLKSIANKPVIIVDEVIKDNISIHSGIIKNFISDGLIKKANNLLGDEYRILGIKSTGQGIGSKELVSTINLSSDFLIPKFGVYASEILYNNKWLKSVTFVGNRLSTDNKFSIETHIIDDVDNVVGDKFWVKFIDFIRENKKFDNLSDLKNQILDDLKTASEILDEKR